MSRTYIEDHYERRERNHKTLEGALVFTALNIATLLFLCMIFAEGHVHEYLSAIIVGLAVIWDIIMIAGVIADKKETENGLN